VVTRLTVEQRETPDSAVHHRSPSPTHENRLVRIVARRVFHLITYIGDMGLARIASDIWRNAQMLASWLTAPTLP
jgi:hypothetical protein